jgi:hypothetical protein
MIEGSYAVRHAAIRATRILTVRTAQVIEYEEPASEFSGWPSRVARFLGHLFQIRIDYRRE